jgi:SPP1 family predicted phage head-tail adaptor
MPVIGQLDQLITFEAASGGDDGYGGKATAWTPQAQAWASVKPVSAREGERQGAERASTIYMFEVWQDGLSAVTEASRIRWETAILNIREIRRPPVRTMMMTIIAETGVTQ